jgi:hypothetical protein
VVSATDNNFLTNGNFNITSDILNFYTFPISDNRVWKSCVYDIYGGDNFADFCEEFFELLDAEEYWEN